MVDDAGNNGIMALVEGCRNNDRRSQTTLFEKLKGTMMGTCRSVLNREEDAEDCLMDGFEAVFSNIHSFDGDNESSFKCWVRTIIRNKCVSKYRENRLKCNTIQIDDTDTDIFVVKPDSKLEYNDIIKIIDGIPGKRKEAFVMKEIEGMGYREIYETTGENESTIRTRVCRFKKTL
jgi:RNA polymerase sigma-70 factor (ECF subfamily)